MGSSTQRNISAVGLLQKIGALFRSQSPSTTAGAEETPDLLLDGYAADIHRQNLISLGKEYKPEDIRSFRERARYGDPRFLYALYDEMIRLGPGPQKTKAIEAMKGASVQFVTFPEEYDDDDAIPEGANPQAVANARAARDFLKDILSERLPDLIEIHADQDFYGIADSKLRLLPRGDGRRYESIEDITPIPARRHKLDSVTHEWMLMTSPDSVVGVPIASVALQADRGLEGVFFTEIGAGSTHLDQRGLLFQCLVPWGIQQFAVRWRAKYMELFGIPPRIGFTDFADPKRTADMKEMLKSMGSTSYGVFHRSPTSQETDVKLLEASATGTSDPYAAQLEWCELAYAMIILGHSQASSVQRGAGSKIPAETAQEQFQNLINSRLRTLAGQIRRGLGRTLVARNLGSEIALRHNPIIRLRYADRDDPKMLADVALTLQKAGAGESISVEDLVMRCNLRVAEPGEKSLAPVAAAASAPGQQLAPVSLAAKPSRTESRLESFALGLADGSGEEITAPARKLIDRAVAEKWPPTRLLVELVALQNKPANAPELEDRLAAAWAEGIGTGKAEIQNARLKRVQ